MSGVKIHYLPMPLDYVITMEINDIMTNGTWKTKTPMSLTLILSIWP